MTWDQDFDRFLKKFDDNVDDLAVEVSLEIATRFILRSPVDTGFFRSNWQIDQGSAPSGTVSIRSKDEAMSAAQSAIQDWDIGSLLYIVNNTEYGIFLEEGHSDQAPTGIVDVTLIEFQDILTGALNELR